MPTRPRIDLAGYHHVINRGVNRCNVFNHPYDKEAFLGIINKTALMHKVILHDYCLMDNHYHLLIETQTENLSAFMRIVNANYAQYFNKKYHRSGHLWQDRYSSKYITSEGYLYTLIRYIEYNPIEAGISVNIGEYPFTLGALIFNYRDIIPCSKDSILFRDYNLESLKEFLNISMTQKDIEYLKAKQKQKIKRTDDGIKLAKLKKLEEHFLDIENNQDRDLAIMNAYLDGHTQVSIAKLLKLSTSLVSKIIKSEHKA